MYIEDGVLFRAIRKKRRWHSFLSCLLLYPSIIHFPIRLEFLLQKFSDTSVKNNHKHISSITLLLTKDRIDLTYLRTLLFRSMLSHPFTIFISHTTLSTQHGFN